MADDGIKQAFIEAFRATPDGIQDFLETAIPTAPGIASPGDVDAAIIANGICAKFIMDLLHPFGGLTPVELLLRIGQHNSVLESAMLAGLEYLEDSDEGQQDFAIVEPETSAAYFPGNLRLVASASNGIIDQVAVECGALPPVALASDDGLMFYGFLHIEELGEHSATFSALFDDGETQTASVSFTISDEANPTPPAPIPRPPDGGDLPAMITAKDGFDAAAEAAIRSPEETAIAALAAAASKVVSTSQIVAESLINVGAGLYDRVAEALSNLMSGRALRRGLAPGDLFTAIGRLKAAIDALYVGVIAEYNKNNPHDPGGYTSCPEVLRGAALAANQKYGPGSVSW